MTIILDLDDVLANLRESLYTALSKFSGIDKHWRDWAHYDLTQHFSIEASTLDSVLITEQVLELCQPEPGAVAATEALKAKGFELAIVTARGWHPQAFALTQAWLQTQKIIYDHLIVVPLGSDKREALSPFAEIVLAVDDHPSNIKRYEASGIPTLMVDMPWNAGYESRRIDSIQAVLAHV